MKIVWVIAIFLLLSNAGKVLADNSTDCLLGDWAGIRPALEEFGITSEAIVTLDYASVLAGGLKRDSELLGDVDLAFSLDTERAGGWSNGTFFIYLVGIFGDSISEDIGDFQAADNIEAYGSVRVLEAWYEHTFKDNPLSLKAGLHDLNSEFGTLFAASTLINSSFGLTPDLSQVGVSTYPETALGVRAALRGESGMYGQAAVYDGVPGDPSRPQGTRIRFDEGDGLLSIGELGYGSSSGGRLTKVAIGGWYHSKEFEDLEGRMRSANNGEYLLAEHQLYCEVEDCSQGLSLFGQAGTARPAANSVGDYFGGGLSYTGLFDNRDEDVFSLGVAHARTTPSYRRANEGFEKAETAFEMTYFLKLTSYLSLQPDLQFVMDPSADPSVDDAWVSILRLQAAL